MRENKILFYVFLFFCAVYSHTPLYSSAVSIKALMGPGATSSAKGGDSSESLTYVSHPGLGAYPIEYPVISVPNLNYQECSVKEVALFKGLEPLKKVTNKQLLLGVTLCQITMLALIQHLNDLPIIYFIPLSITAIFLQSLTCLFCVELGMRKGKKVLRKYSFLLEKEGNYNKEGFV